MPPEERQAKIKDAAQKKFAELQKKKEDGSITDSEKETLKRLEERLDDGDLPSAITRVVGIDLAHDRDGSTGESASAQASSLNEIDLLLTDVVMPESISGRDLAHKLIMDKPDLKVIFTSGYSAELIGPEFEQEKEHGFLSKPYLTDRLAKTVAAQLSMARKAA